MRRSLRPLVNRKLQHDPRRRLSYQTLEARQVLSAMAVLDTGVVTITADDSSNIIAVRSVRETQSLVVNVDGTVFEFPNALVRHLVIDARGGGDVVSIHENVRQTTSIDGGSGNDVITGSMQADRIAGGPGFDVIHARGGDDRVSGGDDGDYIEGGDGNDMIEGGGGGDILFGGQGRDSLDGGAGNDYLIGGVGNDNLDGGDGDDKLSGGEGRDRVFGGNGNDWLHGGPGSDYLDGGEGRDRINSRDGEEDWIFTDGFDELITDRLDHVAIP